MTPAFRIIADSRDITHLIKDRLISLSIKDEAGVKADAVDIVLDDRDGKLAEPSDAATLEVFIGYANAPLIRTGLYKVDEAEWTGPPDRLKISGKAADVGGALKDQKTRGWDQPSIASMVETIAADQGLKPLVSERFANISYAHIAQRDESDIHLLTRIGKDHDALVAVKHGRLMFTTLGEGLSASGAVLPITIIGPTDHSTHAMRRAGRGKFAAVNATWSNVEGGKRQHITIGEGKPVKSIRHAYGSKPEAERAATAKSDAMKRGERTLSLSLPGRPGLFAEGPIKLRAFRAAVNGRWAVKSIAREIGPSAFKTKLEAEAAGSN